MRRRVHSGGEGFAYPGMRGVLKSARRYTALVVAVGLVLYLASHAYNELERQTQPRNESVLWNGHEPEPVEVMRDSSSTHTPFLDLIERRFGRTASEIQEEDPPGTLREEGHDE